jgi:hypothetical protein
MRNNKRFSLHKIDDDKSFTFCEKEYSRFKFGSKSVSRKFGTKLGEAFCKYVLPDIIGPIVILSSPYCFIPTATFAMKDYFVRVVNNCLAMRELPVVEETKIHRTITYKEDYGALNAEERLKLISGDGFHIDKEFIKGKTLILLDDVRITGSHEIMIDKMLDSFDIEEDCVFTYFAELVNDDVHPSVENTINYAYVNSLLSLDHIIKNDDFILNTRVVKYMLCSPEEEFKTFANYQNLELLRTIYHLAVGNSYHTINDYIVNLSYIKYLIDK